MHSARDASALSSSYPSSATAAPFCRPLSTPHRYPKPAANFVLFETGSVETASKVYSGLKEQGLLVRYWGSRPDLNTKLRVTVGARQSNERFVELVAQILAKK
jgi:histidinol-phosphate/aromatic aminotransferase/cobyric acid decarboxylase-like protein